MNFLTVTKFLQLQIMIDKHVVLHEPRKRERNLFLLINITRWFFRGFRLLAEDDMGVQSPVLDVFVNMCSGCSNHGNCDFDNLLSSEENKFRKVACDCDPGYFGMLSISSISYKSFSFCNISLISEIQVYILLHCTCNHVNHYNTQNVLLCFVGFFPSKTYMYKDKTRLCKK